MSTEPGAGAAAFTVLAWQRAHWVRVAPGRLGTALLAVIGFAFFLPLGTEGLFGSWEQGSVAIASLGALFLGVAVGRDTTIPRPEELWIYQKGVSLADWGLNRWLADTFMAAGVVLWWTLCWAMAALAGGHSLDARGVAAVFCWLLTVYLLVTCILFVIGASGSRRGSELLFVLMLAAAVQPLLVRAAPAALARAANLLLPPLQAASAVRGGISGAESLRVIAPAAFHVAAFIALMMGAGVLLLSRRRPLA